jgi:hypothetical protein
VTYEDRNGPDGRIAQGGVKLVELEEALAFLDMHQ